MKVYFFEGAMLPLNQATVDRMKRTFAEGEIFEVVVPMRDRNLGQHNAYHAALEEFIDNLPEEMVKVFYQIILQDCARNGQVDHETVHQLLKKIHSLDSESFDECDQEQADRYIPAALETLDRWKVILGWRPRGG